MGSSILEVKVVHSRKTACSTADSFGLRTFFSRICLHYSVTAAPKQQMPRW